MDVSKISQQVRLEVAKRGLVLHSPTVDDPWSTPEVVFVAKSDDNVGHVGASMGGGPPFIAFAPNPQRVWINDELAIGLMTWEAGILTVLAAYDRLS